MTACDDDLSAWRDDPLMRALCAPGTSAELAAEPEMVAAYRRVMSHRGVGRVAGRLGAGGTAIVTTIALSSGVAAAAYTQNLPDPVQSIAHEVLGSIGVPSADSVESAEVAPLSSPESAAALRPPAMDGQESPSAPDAPRSKSATKLTPGPIPIPKPSSNPKPEPTGTPDSVSGPSAVDPSPATSEASAESTTSTAEATTGSTPKRDPKASPIHARRTPVAVSATASATRVASGSTVVLTGMVTSDGDDTGYRSVGDQPVWLKLHTPGVPGWAVVAHGRTNADGSYSLTSPDLTTTSILRVSTGHRKARSERVRVVVQPTLSATLTDDAVNISTTGTSPEDSIEVLLKRGHRLTTVREVMLDGNGAALLSFPQLRKPYQLWLRLPATKLHGKAMTVIWVPAQP